MAASASTSFAELSAALAGTLIRPHDATYNEARAVYNAMIDRRPSAIAECADASDVVASVRYAREHDIPVAVRGGGHNAAGSGVADGALVIDLRNLRKVTVDAAARTVRVGGGCVWNEVDRETGTFGLATPSGVISSTGVGGLTLGGGIGQLSRRCGLTVDNLVSADVVLADGTAVQASPGSHPDLFWALRGGGGNFGVVTSFLFRCHKISTVIGGPILYDIAEIGAVLRWYREVQPSLPTEISGFFAVLTIPPGPPFPDALWLRPVCGVIWCFTGPLDRADEVLAPLRGFGQPVLDGLAEMPFSELQSSVDVIYPPGLQWYWRADFFREISDTAIAVHEEFANNLPSPLSTMHLYPIDGAVHRVASKDTAFAYRDMGWAGVIVGVDPEPANAAAITQWTTDYWAALHPTSAGGAYVNFLMDEGEDRVRTSYGANYERLARIKASYDPTNFFRNNQNVVPAH